MAKIFSIISIIIGAILIIFGFTYNKLLIVFGVIWIVIGVISSFKRDKEDLDPIIKKVGKITAEKEDTSILDRKARRLDELRYR